MAKYDPLADLETGELEEKPKQHEGWFHKFLRFADPLASGVSSLTGKALGQKFEEPPLSLGEVAGRAMPYGTPPGKRLVGELLGSLVTPSLWGFLHLGPGLIPETETVSKHLLESMGPIARKVVKTGDLVPPRMLGEAIHEPLKRAVLRTNMKNLDDAADMSARVRTVKDYPEFHGYDVMNPEEIRHDDFMHELMQVPEEKLAPLRDQIKKNLISEKATLRVGIPFVSGPQRLPGSEKLRPLLEKMSDFLRGRKPYTPETESLIEDILKNAEKKTQLNATSSPTLATLAEEKAPFVKGPIESVEPELRRIYNAAKFKHEFPHVAEAEPGTADLSLRQALDDGDKWFVSAKRQDLAQAAKDESMKGSFIKDSLKKTKEGLELSPVVHPNQYVQLFNRARIAWQHDYLNDSEFNAIQKFVKEKIPIEALSAIDKALEQTPFYTTIKDLGGKAITGRHFEFLKNTPAFMKDFDKISEDAIAANLKNGTPLEPFQEEFLKNTTDLTMNSENPMVISKFIRNLAANFDNFEIIVGHGLNSPRITARVYGPFHQVISKVPNIAEGIPGANRWFGGLVNKNFPGVEIHPETLKVRQWLANQTKMNEAIKAPVRAAEHPEVVGTIKSLKFGQPNEAAVEKFISDYKPGIYDDPRIDVNQGFDVAAEANALNAKVDRAMAGSTRWNPEPGLITGAPLPTSTAQMIRNHPDQWRRGDWMKEFLFEETGLVSGILDRLGLSSGPIGQGWDFIKTNISSKVLHFMNLTRGMFDMTFGMAPVRKAFNDYSGQLQIAEAKAMALKAMKEEQWGVFKREEVKVEDFMRAIFNTRAYDHPASREQYDYWLATLKSHLKNPEDYKRIMADFQATTDRLFAIHGPDAYALNYVEWQLWGKDTRKFLDWIPKDDFGQVIEGGIGGRGFMDKPKSFANYADYRKFMEERLAQFKLANPDAEINFLDRADVALAHYMHESLRLQAMREFFGQIPKIFPNHFIPDFRVKFMLNAIKQYAKGPGFAALTPQVREQIVAWMAHLNQFRGWTETARDIGRALESHPILKQLDRYVINPSIYPWLKSVLGEIGNTIHDDYGSQLINALRGSIMAYKTINVFNPTHILRVFTNYAVALGSRKYLFENIKRIDKIIKEGINSPEYLEMIGNNVIVDGNSEIRIPWMQKLMGINSEQINPFFKPVSNFNNATTWRADKVMRAAHYLYAREKLGMAPFEAAEATHRYLIDYSMRYMPRSTKNYVRLLFPFYSWWSGNLALHATEFAKSPGKYLAWLRTLEALNTGNAGHDMESNPQGFIEKTDIGKFGPQGQDVYVQFSGIMPSLQVKTLVDDLYMKGPLGAVVWLKTRLWPPIHGLVDSGVGGYGQAPEKMQQDITQRAAEVARNLGKQSVPSILNSIWGPLQLVKFSIAEAKQTARGKPLNPDAWAEFLGMNPTYYPKTRVTTPENQAIYKYWEQKFLKQINPGG